jgi:hypothetical protein
MLSNFLLDEAGILPALYGPAQTCSPAAILGNMMIPEERGLKC